jgi:hypothetical protein
MKSLLVLLYGTPKKENEIYLPKAISGYCPERFAWTIISLICDFRLWNIQR